MHIFSKCFTEKALAPHSNTLVWKLSWMEEPGRLHAVHGITKSQTQLSDFTFTFHFHALEKEMATHSSVLAWRIPGTAEPSGRLSVGLHRVGHDWSDLAVAANVSKRFQTTHKLFFTQNKCIKIKWKNKPYKLTFHVELLYLKRIWYDNSNMIIYYIMMTAAMKLKDAYSLEGKLWPT